MKNKGFIPGLLCGALLAGLTTTAFAVSGVMAELSSQPIYVDGQQVQMTAYAINGNNYVKLRDVRQAVDFNVYWDGGVQIDSNAPYTGVAPAQVTGNDAVAVPQSDAKLTLKVGDTVQCDDGTTYAITDMSRYDSNAFSAGPLGALPTATCDWSSFPTVELPKAEARHTQNSSGDYLFVRNLYESRRMQYTIQNLAGNDPETSENGKLRYGSKGTPYVRIQLSIDQDKNPQSFWPWKESELEKQFSALPIAEYQMEAWDMYLNGAFQYTEYLIYKF